PRRVFFTMSSPSLIAPIFPYTTLFRSGVVAKAAHPSCGLLLDTYHLQRSGARLAAIEDVVLGEIAYVQYSDVPRTGLEPGKALEDRKSTRLNSSHGSISYAVFCLKKKS